ncbi:MAG: GNAT family N-acetyltransferase [Alphaproteobacteria bacterium]
MIPSGFSLRPARLVDAEAISRVHVISWRETYRGIIDQPHLDGRTVEDRTEMWRAVLSQLPPNRVFLVVEDEGREVVGFAYGGPARDPAHGRAGELYAMYLLKKCQGAGVGRALFEAFWEGLKAAGIGDFYAMVLQGNPSRGFYIKMGGRSCGFSEGTIRGRRAARRFAEEKFEWA